MNTPPLVPIAPASQFPHPLPKTKGRLKLARNFGTRGSPRFVVTMPKHCVGNPREGGDLRKRLGPGSPRW